MGFDIYSFALATSNALLASLWVLPIAALLAYCVTIVLPKCSKNALYITSISTLIFSVLIILCVFFIGLYNEISSSSPTIDSASISTTARTVDEASFVWQFNAIWLFCLWSAGATIGVLKLLFDIKSLNIVYRQAQHLSHDQIISLGDFYPISVRGQTVEIRTSKSVINPFACFVNKQVIIVPKNFFEILPPGEYKSILNHEVAHIERRDVMFVYFERIIACVLFFEN
jgi:beta-lactamase regulating signal transducer with metallopeptidase domain